MTALPSPTRIALADDHASVLEGLKLLLSVVDGVTVVGTAVDGAALRTLLATQPVDLLVLDLHMPALDVRQFLGEARTRFPAMRVLVLTGDGDAEAMSVTMAAGAHGFLVKRSDVSELLPAIEALRLGQPYIGAGIGHGAHVDQRPRGHAAATVPDADDVLTRRECQILALIARGATASEIAAELGISPFTVRKHRENLMRKLSLHNTAELVAHAVRVGLRTV